jgi:2,4-dienoyl-CoA reductase-like NADH-dependent reductase (Old Yellow Enzyme family)/thioredoxin reductase
MDKNSFIFQPIKVGNLTLKNRIQVSPAAPLLAGHGGENTQAFMEYTRQLALSGAGLVTLGIASVDPQTTAFGARILSASNPLYIGDLSEIADMIHDSGALASIELVYAKYMVGPASEAVNTPSAEEIRHIIDSYAQGALNCKLAGFDMVMIHGGHGNVPARFFSSAINRRTDQYGGSFENRARFAVELLDAVREKTGGSLAVEYRISGEELTPDGTKLDETLKFAQLIQDKIDMLHVSRGILENDQLLPYIMQPTYFPRAMNLEAAKKFKQQLHIPVSVVGSFDLETAEKAVSGGDVDVVAMIRTIIAGGKDCVNDARSGHSERIRPCVRCNTCIGRTHSQFIGIRCAVNPTVGRETSFPYTGPAAKPKKVMLIGGGPANLEAARTASKRGHTVTLYEKNEELGGMLRTAATASFKQDMKRYLEWSIRSVTEDPNITVHLRTEATPDLVRRENPDALIVAVGAKPILPAFSAGGTGKVAWVGDVELGKASVGNTVVIAGAGFTGLEMALELARSGKTVQVIDMIPESQIGAGGIAISMTGLKQLLSEAHVSFMCEVRLEDVNEEGAVIRKSDGTVHTIPCDTVIMSLGVRPDTKQVESFSGIVEKTYFIGDCAVRGGTLYKATSAGFNTAMKL